MIEVGDFLAGYSSTVSMLETTHHAFNDSGQLVLATTFTNSTRRLLRADPLALALAIPVTAPVSTSQFADIVAALVGTDNALLSQIIPTPRTSGELVFDYLFATTKGELLVQLGGTAFATITAPSVLLDGSTTVRVPLDSDLFRTRTLSPTVSLEFILNGMGIESGVLLNNIVIDGLLNGDFQTGDLQGWETGGTPGSAVGVNFAPGSQSVSVPEPTTLGLLSLGFAGAMVRCRRRNRYSPC